jgi:glycerol-3-phosphate dehydrogenase
MAATLAAVRAQAAADLPDDVLEHLVRSYGARHADVIALARQVEGGLERVVPAAPVIRAQLHFGARHEQSRTPDDLVWRRTELGPRGLVTDDVRRLARRIFESEATVTHPPVTREP